MEPGTAKSRRDRGSGLIVVRTVARARADRSPFGLPFWIWVVGTLAGLALLWRGLNGFARISAHGSWRLLRARRRAADRRPVRVRRRARVITATADLLTGPHVPPPAPTTIAFDQLMRIPYFEDGLRNSLLVSTTAAIVTTLLGLLGAYAIARLRFPAGARRTRR